MPYAVPPPPSRVRSVISVPRFATYERAAGNNRARATELYGWNARVSAALLLPMHFAEITGRNVVHDALTAVYGPDWPWNSTFRGSLPSPRLGYKPREDLQRTAGPIKRQPTGKVIAEMNFVFWQTMFTAGHHDRVWNQRLAGLLPQAGNTSERDLRQRVQTDLEVIRTLRNRVAHHEPIHARPLADDLKRMLDLVDLRCAATGRWVRGMEEVTALLPVKP